MTGSDKFKMPEVAVRVPICHTCKNWHTGSLTCNAFVGGIPVGILTGRLDHKKPIDGDNGIQYEPA